jgi:hypothetical protein
MYVDISAVKVLILYKYLKTIFLIFTFYSSYFIFYKDIFLWKYLMININNLKLILYKEQGGVSDNNRTGKMYRLQAVPEYLPYRKH